jgi:hypothetical protein
VGGRAGEDLVKPLTRDVKNCERIEKRRPKQVELTELFGSGINNIFSATYGKPDQIQRGI